MTTSVTTTPDRPDATDHHAASVRREIAQRVAIARGLIVWVIPASVGWAVLAVTVGSTWMIAASVAASLGCTAALLLHRTDHTTAGRHLPSTVTTISIGIGANVAGRSADLADLLIALVAVCFVSFSWRAERRHLLIAISQPLVVLAASFATGWDLFGVRDVTVTDATNYLAPASELTTLAVILFVLVTLTRSTARTEHLLVDAVSDAEAASDAKSTFLANMSHELRTPMNGVVGLSELIDGQGMTSEERRHLEAITSSARSMLTIIDDILDLSKLESGKVSVESIDMSPLTVVENVALEFSAAAVERHIVLRVAAEGNVPATVRSDPTRLRQIVRNLVGNAVRFASPEDPGSNGQVDVRLRWHTGTLEIEVEDDGIGIAPGAVAGLFDPFTQADQSTTRRFGGTGLGLSIVANLVDNLAGTVDVRTALGVGSTFTVRIPCSDPDGTVAGPADPPAGAVIGLFSTMSAAVLEPMRGVAPWIDRLVVATDEDDLVRLVAESAGKPLLLIAAGDTSANLAVRDRLPAGDVWLLSIGRDRSDATTGLGPHDRAVSARPLLPTEFVDAVRLLCSEVEDDRTDRPPAADDLPQFGARVLVVEDNTVNQRVLQAQLTRLGCTVDLADYGRSGLQRFRGEHYDLVLSDVQMPVMDGWEFATEARRHERERGLERRPILAITASTFETERQKCLDAGMDECLVKPVTLAHLATALAEYLPAN
jgi:two-component system sensor histidine kinase/response regulator